MGERSDGQWTTPRVGISVPRQNGKGAIIEARELAGLLLFGERLIIHSAHEQKTARVGFERILSYFENHDDLRKRVKSVISALNREMIELKTGQQLRFLARSKGSGRGFSADCLILDEAQILAENTWAAILPTISARPNPQTWLLGTPPTPQDDGEVFARFRAGGLEGKDHRLCWCEWSASEDANYDDPAAWGDANPAYGIRIDRQTIEDERASTDDDTFARERLGMWAGSTSHSVIDPLSWSLVADPASMAIEQLALSVDVSYDRTTASVSLAGRRHDGLWHVELDEQRTGTGWLAAWVAARCDRNDIRAVVMDSGSPASSLIEEFADHGVKVTTTSTTDIVAACGQFFDAVMQDKIRHTDQPQVNVALSMARKKPVRDGWIWNRKSADSDITPIIAGTLALWGAQTATAKKPTRKRTSERRAVML